MKLVLILVIFFTAKSELFEFLSDETVDNFHGHPYGHPKPLMWLESNNDSIMVDYEIISNIFFNEDIADRKIVVVSVIGALRKGKSFLLDYFLRYMYNNVS